jgi:RimJ/RimL family protein N-acetyltransferase
MLQLRRTIPQDLDFVVNAESAQDTRQFIIPWTAARHAAAIADPDCVHLIVSNHQNQERLGFVMLFGAASVHRSIELRRIVIVAKGAGVGRIALRAARKHAFLELNAHRLWLDVKSGNARARHLYGSEGFREEGMLRECILEEDGNFESLVVMSMLRMEFLAGENTPTMTV